MVLAEGESMTTGEKIAMLRKRKNITQEQLAEILGVSRQ
ncbi:MAG: helix-turn-helix domain-containing protein, partial [Acetatifactor sp.]|nr:helix-turn-helix domain-containing protein [Acetatifactor sp.]